MRSIARIAIIALALVLLGLAFTPKASPAQVAGPCDSTRHVPYGWHLLPAHPCGGDSVSLVFTSCRGCVDLIGFKRPDTGPSILDVRIQEVCPLSLVCRPDSIEVPLGALALGRYAFAVDVHATVARSDSAICTLTEHDTLAFVIGCPEPPQPGPLPFVSEIRIGPPPPCATCPPRICPGEPIPFHVEGAFPSNCWRFERLELMPSPIVGPLPEPPVVRIIVSRNDCLGVACTDMRVPWSGDVLLPGLPPRDYYLLLEMPVVSWCDSTRVDTTFYATRPFTVQDSCLGPPPAPCLMAGWDHSGSVGGCDAFVAPGRPAQAVMTLQTPVPLAGLQGTLHLSPPGLLISALEAIGPAQGVHLTWTRTADGAKFVMFADRGAPIGAVDSAQRCLDSLVPCTSPVLRVTVLPDTDLTRADVTYLMAADLLGSDSLGAAVPECHILPLVVIAARICSGHSCDFNGDGSLDVRDLVTMVHCVLDTGVCPDTTRARLDCDGDGVLNVDDVLCCARTVLRGGQRDTVPGRPEPAVAVSLGEPAMTAGGIQVPVSLQRPDLLGAVRLAFDFPSDRYDVAGVAFGQSTPGWLEVHEVVGGRLVVGLLSLGPTPVLLDGTTPNLDLRVRLVTKAGQSAGGEVALADAQFAGPDGATLQVDAHVPPVTLPAAGALALSAAQPNPFSRETRFALNLERGADAEVTIHDLSGRLVATLFHGALGAGPHTFTWQGLRSDGSAAPNGVYFVHARVGGERLTRKVVFLPGN
jgi:hypothetical protein